MTSVWRCCCRSPWRKTGADIHWCSSLCLLGKQIGGWCCGTHLHSAHEYLDNPNTTLVLDYSSAVHSTELRPKLADLEAAHWILDFLKEKPWLGWKRSAQEPPRAAVSAIDPFPSTLMTACPTINSATCWSLQLKQPSKDFSRERINHNIGS